MAIDWSRGYSCEVRAYEVDPATWADASRVGGVTSARVERSLASDVETLERGTLAADLPADAPDLTGRYLRVAVIARQAGAAERADVATLLCVRQDGTLRAGRDEATLACESVLWPASLAPPDVAFASAGADGAELAARMLSASVAAPVAVEGGFTLEDAYVFDPGDSALSCALRLLEAGGYRASVDGRGRVSVGPAPTSAALDLSLAGARLLVPGVAHTLDLSGVPNRWRAVDGGRAAQAVNDDPLSRTSTASRGYVSEVYDDAPTRVDGESLAGYCARRLAEASTVWDTRTYAREWWPGVVPGDLVESAPSSLGVRGELRVRRQTVEAGNGILVTEESALEVRLWPTS